MIIKPLSLYIGLRYTRAKRRNRFISFISLASMVGIALGVTVLITVLSVINGFDEQIRDRFFAIAPQVTVMTGRDISETWPGLSREITHLPNVQAAAPFVSGQAVLMQQGMLHGINVVGIIPQQEARISQLAQQTAGGLKSLTPGSFNLILGKTLAKKLGLKIGDSVNLLTVQFISADLLPQFKYKHFNVAGIFTSAEAFGFEDVLIYTAMADAQELLTSTRHISGLHIRLKDLYQASQVNKEIRAILPQGYAVSDWTQQSGAFFQSLAMQKMMLFVILLLIVAIAVFNLVSTLIMVVNEKQADIAILRTLGATPRMIMNTFIVQGSIIGLVGTVCGLIGGVLLASNATAIVEIIQQWFHVKFISSSVYFVDYLPSKIIISDLVKVCCIAFGLSILATLYPALVAFRNQPAEALRYE